MTDSPRAILIQLNPVHPLLLLGNTGHPRQGRGWGVCYHQKPILHPHCHLTQFCRVFAQELQELRNTSSKPAEISFNFLCSCFSKCLFHMEVTNSNPVNQCLQSVHFGTQRLPRSSEYPKNPRRHDTWRCSVFARKAEQHKKLLK